MTRKDDTLECSDSKDDLREIWRKAVVDDTDEDISSQISKQQDKEPIAVISIDLKKLQEEHEDEYIAFTTNIVDSVDVIKGLLVDNQLYGFQDVLIVTNNFNNIENIEKKKIRELRSEDIGKMVVFNGLVKNSSGVVPKLQLIAFNCDQDNGCGVRTYVVQDGEFEDTSMAKCYCGAQKDKLTRDDDKSVFINFMKCDIEEDPEGLRGRQPERISCEFVGPLTEENKRIGVGDRVTILGIFKARAKNKNSLIYDRYIDVLGAVKRGKNYEELVVSPDDEKKFVEMSQDKDLLMKISKAVAPNIAGHDVEKSAVVLQMAGGNLQAGDRRGNIHILLIGDPGTGKSKMVRNFVDVAPHAVKASGAPTTTVGLTACVIKDEDTPGGYVLEAGAAVLADGGLLIVDEFDKMDKTVRGAMHEIMEDQRTTISKANINTELNTRCAVLAIMNPKRNRFNREEIISDQIDLPQSLLSRFDLIFAIRDIVDEDADRLKCEAIIRARVGTEVDSDYSKEDITRYLTYVRSKIKNITPTPEAAKLLTDRFLQIRTSNQDDTIPITLRQMEGMMRLSEACAKLRLSNVVEKEDAEIALGIITYYLDTMCMDPGTHRYDIGMTTGGESSTQQKTRVNLRNFVEANLDELTEGNRGLIKISELERAFKEATGADERTFEKALQENNHILMLKDSVWLEYIGDKKRKCVLNDEYPE